MAFATGSATALGFLKAEHWYQTEKFIAVGILPLEYGSAGIALATMASIIGMDEDAVSGDSVGASMTGFVPALIASVWFHTVALPAGKAGAARGQVAAFPPRC